MQFQEEWMSSGLCFKGTVCHGVTQQEFEATDHMNSQEAESKECLCSAHFLLFTQSRTKEWYGLFLEWVFPP